MQIYHEKIESSLSYGPMVIKEKQMTHQIVRTHVSDNSAAYQKASVLKIKKKDQTDKSLRSYVTSWSTKLVKGTAFDALLIIFAAATGSSFFFGAPMEFFKTGE